MVSIKLAVKIKKIPKVSTLKNDQDYYSSHTEHFLCSVLRNAYRVPEDFDACI